MAKRELKLKIKDAELKLFKYPHKFGGGSSWTVGLEKSHTSAEGTFVSQRFFYEWSEDYEMMKKSYESWAEFLK